VRASAELLLFLVLGAADHAFTIPALVKRVFGVDVRSAETTAVFSAMFVDILSFGLFGRPLRLTRERRSPPT
jgi:hypothetical protein